MPKYLTLVAVGDNDSRRTELLLKYTGNYKARLHKDCVFPRFVNNVQSIVVDGVPYDVFFVDAECDDDYEILRREAIENADCVLLCYSIASQRSFESISRRWCLEIRKYAPFTPIILIGTGAEARGNNNDTVSTEQGENLKLLIGAYAFIECSIENFLGIDEIFIEAVRSTYHRNKF